MAILAWIVVLLAGVLGLLAIPFGLPGQYFLVAAGAIWLALPLDPSTDPFTAIELMVLLLFGLMADVIETVSGIVGGKKVGGSRRAAWGALIGGFAGAILGTVFLPIPIVGSLVGTLVGTFVGAAGAEYSLESEHGKSARVGLGALIGRIIGILAKIAISGGILCYAAWRLVDTFFGEA